MLKDWTGNNKSAYTCNGASNHSDGEREINDYYATEPKALELLLEQEEFQRVWEPACGEGHLSKVLEKYRVLELSSDLIDRGYGKVFDFFSNDTHWDGDIITNPPYAVAKDFVLKAIERVTQGHKVAMFLKLTFLESKSRKELFTKYPPKTIYVSSSRLQCAKNGDFETYSKGTGTAIAYAWFVWEKGFSGDPIIRWIN